MTLALRTTSSKRDVSARRRASSRQRLRACAQERFLAGAHSLAAFDEQAVAIEGIDALARLLFGEAFFFHGGDEQIDDADACRAGAEHGDGLLLSGTPVAWTAASRVAVVTAAVPWMSSLKVQRRLR